MADARHLPLGPLIFDIDGPHALTDDDRERLAHPNAGGVILFARNFGDREQLRALVAQIHALRSPCLLVCVDQEGGRVQRFRTGFVDLPPLAQLGAMYERDPGEALRIARSAGWVMARELRECDIDFSFAPVLDVARVKSTVIGDRAFHHDPDAVSALAGAFIDGVQETGMKSVGKHFPGHGGVSADSHLCLPRDPRTLDELWACDLVPYQRLVSKLAGVMTAHVAFPAIEETIPTYSRFWLREQLRGKLGFRGVVFSDDLNMRGADGSAPVAERAGWALTAGCDFVLLCNDRGAVDAVLDGVRDAPDRDSAIRQVMAPDEAAPLRSSEWRIALADIDALRAA